MTNIPGEKSAWRNEKGNNKFIKIPRARETEIWTVKQI